MHVFVVTADHLPVPAVLPQLRLRPVVGESGPVVGATFAVTYYDEAGRSHSVGRVLVGQPSGDGAAAVGSNAALSDVVVPVDGDGLPSQLYSLGVDEQYYAALHQLPQHVRDDVLESLQDLAFTPDRDDVVPPGVNGGVATRWADMQESGRRGTPYQFTFRAQLETGGRSAYLVFAVHPESVVPTNVHVLIGRNGVGKTTILHHMVQALRSGIDDFTYGVWADNGSGLTLIPDASAQFSTVVSMNFGSFDAERESAATGAMQTPAGSPQFRAVRHTENAQEQFADAMRSTITSSRLGLWCNAMTDLCADPLLAELDVVGAVAAHLADPEAAVDGLLATYQELSAGHKSVLLGVTFLVHHAQAQSLVLLDEPETHLHPPLLSAYMRALGRIMRHRNAVCIIATHSPVVVAEVPSACVHVVHRIGGELLVKRPRIETFGENVSVLTEEVFGLDVAGTGFHKVVADACERFVDYGQAHDYVGGALGSEARAVLFATYAHTLRREGRE